jgi:hypothetical protein
VLEHADVTGVIRFLTVIPIIAGLFALTLQDRGAGLHETKEEI